ncbi:MAG: hypothetical protein PVF75_05095, partial [Granulosicoccaceae bacterium]
MRRRLHSLFQSNLFRLLIQGIFADIAYTAVIIATLRTPPGSFRFSRVQPLTRHKKNPAIAGGVFCALIGEVLLGDDIRS